MGPTQGADDRSRGDRTAARLERIAVDLVLERGVTEVTVDDICEDAGISQRTFFNHFKTKEEAVFGREFLGLDERDVREFLVADGHDVVADVMRLLIAMQARHGDRELFLKRKRMIHANPAMVTKHMARMRAVRDELCELVYLRIRRTAPAGETETGTRHAATVIVEFAALILRLGFEADDGATPPPFAEPEGAGLRLREIIDRSLA